MSEREMALWILLALLFAVTLCYALVLRRQYRNLRRLRERELQEEKRRQQKNDIRDAMLPEGLLRLFDRGELSAPRLGEETKIRAAVMSFNVSGFSELIRSRTPAEIFGYVNGILKDVVPQVLYQEGEIDKYVDAGLTAFYMGEPEKALRSAVSVCEALEKENAEKNYSIGLSYGDVMAGLAGHEKRLGVLTISETTGIAEFLQEIAGKYGSRILMSGSLKEQIPDFERNYSSRYLGQIYLRAAGQTEELYDVYDGDSVEDKNGKRRTRLLFEKGVEFFQERRFYDARLHFIEVLKANRMDRAAKEYLYLCSRYLGEDEREQKQAPVYLEVF